MKKKTIFLWAACIAAASILKAQMVVSDPAQNIQSATIISQNASILSEAVQTFHQLQQTYSQGQASYTEFVQMKNYLENAEERLKNIGDIKDLKLNNVGAILDKVLCIKQGNYFPKAIKFSDIISRMKAAFLNCSNLALYDKTYCGFM